MTKNTAFTKWLRGQFEARDLTMREVAKVLGLQVSQIWKILENQRRIQLREIPLLAELAGVSSQEFMARMGIVVGGMDFEALKEAGAISVGPAGLVGGSGKGKKASGRAAQAKAAPVKSARLVGWVDATLAVHEQDLGTVIAPSGVVPVSVPLIAYRFQTMGGSGYQPFDGALAFVRHGPAEVSAEAFGRLCVVRTGAGLQALRVVGRGYVEGTYNLFGIDGAPREMSQALLSAVPVALIKFP